MSLRSIKATLAYLTSNVTSELITTQNIQMNELAATALGTAAVRLLKDWEENKVQMQQQQMENEQARVQYENAAQIRVYWLIDFYKK